MQKNPAFLVSLLALIVAAIPLRADEPAEKPPLDEFLQYSEDEDAGKLKTAIAVYKNEDGVEVHVVGAVHIGDKEYYEQLNKDFESYDSLLFEMVGGRDGLEKEDLQGGGPLHMLQGMMGRTLDLDFQLEEVDYTAGNFVHADMDAETFLRMMGKQKISIFALMKKVSEWEMKQAAERAEKGIEEPDMSMAQVLKALIFGGGKDLKLALGKQFGELNGLMMELDEEASVIIGERNEVALKVMDREIGEGKKKLGIFYGAAHLPDMELRLKKRGFTRTGVEWRTAWFIPKKDGVTREPVGDGKG